MTFVLARTTGNEYVHVVFPIPGDLPEKPASMWYKYEGQNVAAVVIDKERPDTWTIYESTGFKSSSTVLTDDLKGVISTEVTDPKKKYYIDVSRKKIIAIVSSTQIEYDKNDWDFLCPGLRSSDIILFIFFTEDREMCGVYAYNKVALFLLSELPSIQSILSLAPSLDNEQDGQMPLTEFGLRFALELWRIRYGFTSVEPIIGTGLQASAIAWRAFVKIASSLVETRRIVPPELTKGLASLTTNTAKPISENDGDDDLPFGRIVKVPPPS